MSKHKQYAHVDEWLDDPQTKENEYPAKMWLGKFREPAGLKDEKWLKDHRLICRYNSEVYRVVGCSAMGDVWLTKQILKPDGYELRVSINSCFGWLMSMDGDLAEIDLDGPWRITREGTMAVVVDCCNSELWRAHSFPGVYDRIVKDHNDALVPFVSPYASELEDDDEPVDEIPADAHLHDDPLTESRIAASEGWALIDVDSSGFHEIEKDDNDPGETFADDFEAEAYVRAQAAEGSVYHMKAIAIHDEHSVALQLRGGRNLAREIADRAATAINQKAMPPTSSNPYPRQGLLEEVIAELQRRV